MLADQLSLLRRTPRALGCRKPRDRPADVAGGWKCALSGRSKSAPASPRDSGDFGGDRGHFGSSLLDRRRSSHSGGCHSSDHGQFWKLVLRVVGMGPAEAGYHFHVPRVDALGVDFRANVRGLARCGADPGLLLSRTMGVVVVAGGYWPIFFSQGVFAV